MKLRLWLFQIISITLPVFHSVHENGFNFNNYVLYVSILSVAIGPDSSLRNNNIIETTHLCSTISDSRFLRTIGGNYIHIYSKNWSKELCLLPEQVPKKQNKTERVPKNRVIEQCISILPLWLQINTRKWYRTNSIGSPVLELQLTDLQNLFVNLKG